MVSRQKSIALSQVPSPQEAPTLKEIMQKLRAALPELRQRYGVARLGVFGSYVRGAQRQRSDLDVLVEFDIAPTFFQFIEIEDYLSRLTGVKVDLVMAKALKPNIGKRILSEVQML